MMEIHTIQSFSRLHDLLAGFPLTIGRSKEEEAVPNVIDPAKWEYEKDFSKRRVLREGEETRFFESYPNVPHGGLVSYSDWLFQQQRAGRSIEGNPPAGIESVEAWRTRMTGVAPETLPPTGDAAHGVYRGSRHERAQRIAAMRSLQTTTTWESGPKEPKRKGMAERARDYVLKIMPRMV